MVVLGSNHRLSGKYKPHNFLFVINSSGRLVNRYDKLSCTGENERSGDLKYYSPGNSCITFTVKDMKCGMLIYHDFRYPELFGEYKKLGVQLMLISFHNAGLKKEGADNYKQYVDSGIRASAGRNYFWVSAIIVLGDMYSQALWPIQQASL